MNMTLAAGSPWAKILFRAAYSARSTRTSDQLIVAVTTFAGLSGLDRPEPFLGPPPLDRFGLRSAIVRHGGERDMNAHWPQSAAGEPGGAAQRQTLQNRSVSRVPDRTPRRWHLCRCSLEHSAA
jgi:hypothetical protein